MTPTTTQSRANEAPANKDHAERLREAVRAASRQEQFLDVLSESDARARWHAALRLAPLPAVRVALADALGRVLARDIAAPVDVPAFDRSGVDGFAVRTADTDGASETAPKTLRLNDEVLSCGVAATGTVAPGTATVIATGGMMPRGADAVVMIERTDPAETPDGPAILVRRAAAPGQHVAFAGSDIARGERVLSAGAVLSSREIGMIAAVGLAEIDAVRRPRVGVLSTGDELMAPGSAPRPAGVYDSNGAIVAAAIAENGGEPVAYGAFADDEAALEAAIRRSLAECDMTILSGGTSKGAGDLSHRIVSRLGPPGILAHGVALKPGKPLCLAAVGEKPVVVLPGFPTSAIFTFQAFVAPVIRILSGLPAAAADKVEATLPVRLPSDLGRTEFAMVSLARTVNGLVAHPVGKGSGSVTTFSQADGFVTVEAMADGIDAGSLVDVSLIAPLRVPDLVIAGSHCLGLDIVTSAMADRDLKVRVVALGSLGGLAAARRGECDVAPIHLFDEKTGSYNAPFITDGLSLVPGWRRRQGVVFRKGDMRFEGRTAAEAVAGIAGDAGVVMVNRNAGSGTRALADRLLGAARPRGYWNQPKSHQAVVATVAQGRADWGIAIDTAARLAGLGFLPLADEHLDFAVADVRRERPAVRLFLDALRRADVRARIAAFGFVPADL